ncbi:MAG: hypothetical protein ACR2KG_00110 [Nocardioidaceae bacterium]
MSAEPPQDPKSGPPQWRYPGSDQLPDPQGNQPSRGQSTHGQSPYPQAGWSQQPYPGYGPTSYQQQGYSEQSGQGQQPPPSAYGQPPSQQPYNPYSQGAPVAQRTTNGMAIASTVTRSTIRS